MKNVHSRLFVSIPLLATWAACLVITACGTLPSAHMQMHL